MDKLDALLIANHKIYRSMFKNEKLFKSFIDNGIIRIGDLAIRNKNELKRIAGIRGDNYSSIIEFLDKLGLSPGMSQEEVYGEKGKPITNERDILPFIPPSFMRKK